MAGGRADTFDQRADILGRIKTRNRVVATLRLLVPLLGVLAFLVLAAQITLANLARQYGISGIRIDRGVVIVEAPKYSGMSATGSRYVITAREARTPIEKSQLIEMIDANLQLVQTNGASYFATSNKATMNTRANTVKAPGLVSMTGSDGLEGTLRDVDVDSDADIVTSHGAVDLLLSDGTTIVGDSMVREGKLNTWTFTNATVVVPNLPEAADQPEAAAAPVASP